MDLANSVRMELRHESAVRDEKKDFDRAQWPLPSLLGRTACARSVWEPEKSASRQQVEPDQQTHREIPSLDTEIFDHEFEDDYPPRREKRESVFRMLDYCHFPRSKPGQRRRTGFTRNESPSGLCLVTEHPEDVGRCLRVGLKNVDGLPTLDALAQVAWVERQPGGHYWLGLRLIEQSKPTRMKTTPFGLHEPAGSTSRTQNCSEASPTGLPKVTRGEGIGGVPFGRLPVPA